MKKHSKNTKLVTPADQHAMSPIERHLRERAEVDKLHGKIDKLSQQIAVLIQRRAELIAEL